MTRFEGVLRRWRPGGLSQAEAGELLGAAERRFRRYIDRYEAESREQEADMRAYDPGVGPDPQQWLALDEATRIDLVRRFHDGAGIETPNLVGHAAVHVAVESQLALGDPPMIRATLARLMDEDGFDRHDAIHAIAAELLVIINDFMAKKPGSEDVNGRYAARLAALTKDSRHRNFGEE